MDKYVGGLCRELFDSLKSKKGRPAEVKLDVAYQLMVNFASSSSEELTEDQLANILGHFKREHVAEKWVPHIIEDANVNRGNPPREWVYSRPVHGNVKKSNDKLGSFELQYPGVDAALKQFYRSDEASVQLEENLRRETRHGTIKYELRDTYRELRKKFNTWGQQAYQDSDFQVSLKYFFEAKPRDVGKTTSRFFQCILHERFEYLRPHFFPHTLHKHKPTSFGYRSNLSPAASVISRSWARKC